MGVIHTGLFHLKIVILVPSNRVLVWAFSQSAREKPISFLKSMRKL